MSLCACGAYKHPKAERCGQCARLNGQRMQALQREQLKVLTANDFGARAPNWKVEQDAAAATRVTPPVLQPRVVSVAGKRYVAVSAHALLDVLSEAEHHNTRPGHVT